MKIGKAIKALKDGELVARKIWIEDNFWLIFIGDTIYIESGEDESITVFEANSNELLADDWCLIQLKEE